MSHQGSPGATSAPGAVFEYDPATGALIEERQPAVWTPRVGVIEAFRMWHVHGPEELPLGELGPLRLHSMASTEELWPAGEWLEAHCPQHGPRESWRSSPGFNIAHGAAETPAPGCSCGLYADDQSPKALSRATTNFGPTVVGKVEFAGRVVIHERGYRAQRGRIVWCRVLPSKIEGLETWMIEQGLLLSGYPVAAWTECATCRARLVQRVDADQWVCPHRDGAHESHTVISGTEYAAGLR